MSVSFYLSFRCPFCGKAKQIVRAGLDDASGRLVVEHPRGDDCEAWRMYSATPRTRAMFVRIATREVIEAVGGAA